MPRFMCESSVRELMAAVRRACLSVMVRISFPIICQGPSLPRQRQYRIWLPFLFSFGLMISYCWQNADLGFIGDAWETWRVSKEIFEVTRSRSFVEYRGPFVFVYHNALFRLSTVLGIGEVWFYRLYSSLLFALLTSHVFPYIFSYILNRTIRLLEVILFSSIVFYFYRGYFLHPQTDIVSFAFLLFSIYVLIYSLKVSSNPRMYFSASGGLAACSIMSRYNYILAVPFLAIFFLMTLFRRRLGLLHILRMVLFYAVPAVILVLANSSSQLARSSVRASLVNAMMMQKIEWNAGDNNYPGPMTIPEKRGTDVLRREGVNVRPMLIWTDEITVHKYIELYRKYSTEMIFIVAQHLFCGLDITYDSVYVRDYSAPRVLRSVLNYFMLFLAVVVISTGSSSSGSKGENASYLLLAMAVPSLFPSLFHVEVRYFLSVTLTCFAVSTFSLGYGLRIVREKRLYIYGILFIMLCFLNSLNTFNSAERIFPLRIW